MAPKIKFYGFHGSNAVYTGRLMLEHKGLSYTPVMLMPGAHAFIMLALGFETMGVPAMKVDGRRVQGSRAMSRELDELVPERPLFPADAVAREAVVRAERWGEDLQNATRRIFYCIARRDPNSFSSVMADERSLPGRIALRMSEKVVVRLATGAHRASDAAGREDLDLLPERLDQIDAWIGEGLLNGAELNAADFQIAVNVSGLMLSADVRPFIEGRPAAALARRVAPGYTGHLDAILPHEWLASLRVDAAAKAAGGATAADHMAAAVPVA